MPILEANGASLHYDEVGAGTPVVFAHGLLWSSRMYDAQMTALRDRYRCIAYDHRGQGRSAVTRGGYDMDNVAADAAALIEALGAAPCHFVGLSMGGFVGLRLAIHRPELLRSLTLLESAADAEPRRNLPRYLAMAAGVRLVGTRPFVGAVMKIMFGRPFLDDPARAAQRAEQEQQLRGVDKIGAVRATLGVFSRAAVEAQLGAIRTPTLVAVGAEDHAVPPARARRTAAAIAGARFVLIPRAGHTSTVEEPAAVTAALTDFWR